MTGLEKNVHLPNEHTILVIRYIIVGFNVLMGIFALTLAVYVLMQHDEDVRFEQFMPKNSFATPVWAAVVGILLLIAAVLAFYASYSQLMYVLIAYITLMVGIFILQAVIGIGIIRYLPELKVEFKKNMEHSMREFPRNPKSWNDLQQGVILSYSYNAAGQYLRRNGSVLLETGVYLLPVVYALQNQAHSADMTKVHS